MATGKLVFAMLIIAMTATTITSPSSGISRDGITPLAPLALSCRCECVSRFLPKAKGTKTHVGGIYLLGHSYSYVSKRPLIAGYNTTTDDPPRHLRTVEMEASLNSIRFVRARVAQARPAALRS